MFTGGLTAVVAGAGLMGRWHAYEIDRCGGRVAAVVDPDPDRARRLAARHADARACSDLEDALDEVQADVLHLCTPPATHEQLTARALDAGLHTLVEKPLAPDARTTEALLERARSAGRLLCPVHQFLFQRGTRRVLDELPRLGPVRHVDFTALSAGAEGGGDPGGIAREILPHPLSLLARLVPDLLPGMRWKAAEPSPGEVRATGMGETVTTTLLISMSGRPTDNRARVVGDGGTARLNLFHGYAVISPAAPPTRARKAAGPFVLAGREAAAATWNLALRAVRWQPAYPGLRELVRAFHRAAAGGSPSPVSEEETLGVARARDRLLDVMGEPDLGPA